MPKPLSREQELYLIRAILGEDYAATYGTYLQSHWLEQLKWLDDIYREEQGTYLQAQWLDEIYTATYGTYLQSHWLEQLKWLDNIYVQAAGTYGFAQWLDDIYNATYGTYLRLPAGLGQKTKAGSLAVTLASDEDNVNVDIISGPSGGLSLEVQGAGAKATPVTGDPVFVGGEDSGGDLRPFRTDADGHPQVDILSNLAAGAEYDEGDVDVSISGPAVLAEAPSNVLEALQLDFNRLLKIVVSANEMDSSYHAYAENASTYVTLAAAGTYWAWVIDGIEWSYDGELTGVPTYGRVLIRKAGAICFDHDILYGGPGFFNFNRPRRGGANEQVQVELKGGGSGITGKLDVNVGMEWVE